METAVPKPSLLPRLLSLLLVGGLLLLVWFVVLPYQAAVRIDQALARWAHSHPQLNLTRVGNHAFERDYQIAWQPADQGTVLRLNLRIHAHPEGRWRQGAWHWQWASLEMSIASNSPWQVKQWDQQPLRIHGTVSGLGAWRFSLPDASTSAVEQPDRMPSNRAIGSAEARREPGSGRWQVAVDWPGLILQEQATPALRLLLGRTTLSLNQSEPTEQGSRNEAHLFVRRAGWMTPTSQGRFDDLELHTTIEQAAEGRGSGFLTINARNLRTAKDDDSHAAELRLSLSWQGVDTTLGGRLETLLQAALRLARATPGNPTQADLWQRVAVQIPRDDLDETLLSLRHSRVLLDTLSWRTPHGEWRLDGQAIGPLVEHARPSPAEWIVVAGLSAGGTALDWLTTHSALPRTEGGSNHWLIEHHANGWHAKNIDAPTPLAPLNGANPDAPTLPTD